MPQEAYAKGILKKFKMEYCKPICTLIECGTKLSKHSNGVIVDMIYFKSLVESLKYLTYRRPDILYSFGLISHFMEEPKSTHVKVVKRIMCYIKRTLNHGLFYLVSNYFHLVGYSDSD